MNTMLHRGLLIILAMTWPLTAAADVCKDIEQGGTVTIKTLQTTEGCTATLTKDTTIVGSGAGKIVTGVHGVVVKLNGHMLTVNSLPIDFKGDFAIAVHGANAATDKVTFTGVTLSDLSTIECKQAGTRAAAVLWKVKSATVNMSATNAKVRYGAVVGAPMPSEHLPPAQQGNAAVTGPIAYCPGSWAPRKDGDPRVRTRSDMEWRRGGKRRPLRLRGPHSEEPSRLRLARGPDERR